MISKNNISKNFLSLNRKKILSNNFERIFTEIKKDINNPNKTLHVLSKNFSLNLNKGDLKKFKKFNSIAIIGMGGSILGTEAIYNFLEKKIKKRYIFLMILIPKKY